MKAVIDPKPQGKMRQAARVTKHRKLRRRVTRPEVGSLYDIMHEHAGTSLFIRPLYWTDFHTEVLGCRFVQLPPYTTPTPSPPSTPKGSPPHLRLRNLSPTVVSIGRYLNALVATHTPQTVRDTERKDLAMGNLLETLYPGNFLHPWRYKDLDILFGSYYYRAAASCQLVWHHAGPDAIATSFDSATTRAASQPISRAASCSMGSMDEAYNNPPVLAYVSRSHLRYVRSSNFRIVIGPGGNLNEPVRRLQACRSKALMPKDPNEDPYFLGVAIAIAQQSVYANIRTATGFSPRDVKVRLLTVAEEENAFIVYTATVPRALLSMFHEPDTAPTGDSGVTFEHAHVPIWPIMGLKERLGKALGPEVVGEFDGITIDTYDEEVAPAAEKGSKKRGREALSEVFNESFSEVSRYESPVSSPSASKKQRTEKKGGRPRPAKP